MQTAQTCRLALYTYIALMPRLPQTSSIKQAGIGYSALPAFCRCNTCHKMRQQAGLTKLPDSLLPMTLDTYTHIQSDRWRCAYCTTQSAEAQVALCLAVLHKAHTVPLNRQHKEGSVRRNICSGQAKTNTESGTTHNEPSASILFCSFQEDKALQSIAEFAEQRQDTMIRQCIKLFASSVCAHAACGMPEASATASAAALLARHGKQASKVDCVITIMH